MYTDPSELFLLREVVPCAPPQAQYATEASVRSGEGPNAMAVMTLAVARVDRARVTTTASEPVQENMSVAAAIREGRAGWTTWAV